MEEGNQFIRGVVDEATVITTDKGTNKRITVIAPRAVDEETGMIMKTLLSMYFQEVCISGEPVSEVELLALRGYLIEIHFLAGNTAEIRIVD